jgi:hypothetical protein
MSKSERMIDIIAKLFAKADATHSQQEAEALTQKANELLIKYNIDRQKVFDSLNKDGQGDKFESWVTGEKVQYKENLAGNRWRKELIKMLCRHNLCGVIFSNSKDDKYLKRDPTFLVYGDMQNVEMVVWLYHYLDTYLMRMAKESRAALTDEERDMQCRHTYLVNFLDGAIHGIERKLNDERLASELKDQIGQLIKYNDKAIEEYRDKVFGKTIWTSNKSKERKTDLGYEDGFEAGKNVKLSERRLTNAEDKVKSKLLKNKDDE